MKKIYLFLIALSVISFTGCEPMEDIQDEINAELDNELAVGNTTYTLTEDDYSNLDVEDERFNTLDDAKSLIPALLADLYPVYGEESSVNVTFNVLDSIRVEEYTLTSADYSDAGAEEGYFSSLSGVTDFLGDKFESKPEGSYVEVTYRIVATEIPYTLTDDDFDLIGEELSSVYPDPASSAAQYGNFERREDDDAYWSNDMLVEAIGEVISDQFGDVEGQLYTVTYDIYDGSSGSETMTVLFDGNNYVSVGAMSYEVTNADYDFIGVEFATAYPGPAGNAAQFNSFDVRESSGNFWSEDMLAEALAAVLDENFPAAEDGAQFDVSYAIYNGSVATRILSFEKQAGAFVVNNETTVSTIEETNVFALANGSWDMPYVVSEEDYNQIGLRFPNFGSTEEALDKISTLLDLKFPFAEEGDFVPVAYDIFNGSVVRLYANFIFENGSFRGFPNIKQQSLQFGFSDGMWEADNTKRYSFIGDDYSLVSSAFADVYPGPASNVGDFSSFDVRESSGNYWSDDMLIEAMGVVLDNLEPNAEVGQKYVISFAVYNGSVVTETLSLIKNADNEWVLNEA